MEHRSTYLQISKLPSSVHTLKLQYISVPACFPYLAATYIEDPVDLNKLLVKTPAATFFIEVKGDGAIGAFIPPKGLLLVDRSATAGTGDIIIAVVNGEFTIKRLMKTHRAIYLTPVSLRYKAIKVTEGMNFQVWGVVTRVIIDAQEE